MNIHGPRFALIGNVNTEEILAKRLREEGAEVEGYLFFPNAAFADRCHRVVLMDQEYQTTRLADEMRAGNYDAVNIGPVYASLFVSELLAQAGVAHIGATPDQLAFETDKTRIHEVFPEDSGVLPPTSIVTDPDEAKIKRLFERYGGSYVLKFVGDYAQAFKGSETGRVRFSRETVQDEAEALAFVRESLRVSGKAIIQAKLNGREFSANYAVDAAGHAFRMGENVCYKRRVTGNTGPICDGTGSICIGNSLPFLTAEDIAFVEERIVKPFHAFVTRAAGKPFRALLNLDLMKTADGRVVLFEVNCREAGGHTMANILSGLKTPLSDILRATQNDALDTLTPEFLPGASLVVSAYPSYFPAGTADDADLQVLELASDQPPDIQLFLGWVDVLERGDGWKRLRLRNSPSLLFECRADDVAAARAKLYPYMDRLILGRLDYRQDIGIEFA